MSAEKGMKSIWYFVGLVLTTMGGLVLIAGILDLVSPPARTTILSGMHTSVWWGALMLIVGLVFYWTNRKISV
jgi:hypothetical protein